MSPRPRRGLKQHGDSSKNKNNEVVVEDVINGTTSQDVTSESGSISSSTLYSINPAYNLRNSKLTPNVNPVSSVSLLVEPEDDD